VEVDFYLGEFLEAKKDLQRARKRYQEAHARVCSILAGTGGTITVRGTKIKSVPYYTVRATDENTALLWLDERERLHNVGRLHPQRLATALSKEPDLYVPVLDYVQVVQHQRVLVRPA